MKLKPNLIVCILIILITFSFAQVDSEFFLDGAIVTDITKHSGNIWVATYGQGIYSYSLKDEKWKNFSTKSGNLKNDFFYCIAVSNDYIWAGSSEGLFTYDKKKKKWRKRKFALGGEFGNWIRSLYFDEEQNVCWIGRFRNLTRFDASKKRYKDITRIQGKDEKSNNYKVIKADGDSLIWFGTESGLHIYDKRKKYTSPKAWKYITNFDKNFEGLGEDISISDFLFEDGNVWIATDEFVTEEKPVFNVGGIFVYDRRSDWKRIYEASGLGGNGIYCLERTGNVIWAAVYNFDKKKKSEYGKGIYLINRLDDSITPVDLNQIDIQSSSVISMYFDGMNMWLGTKNGLVKIKIINALAEWNAGKRNRNF